VNSKMASRKDKRCGRVGYSTINLPIEQFVLV
jgi:hypothetical protein